MAQKFKFIDPKDLSTEAQQIVQSKKISGMGKKPFKFWHKLLRELANFDQSIDTLIQKTKTKSSWCIAGLIILLILTVIGFVSSNDSGNAFVKVLAWLGSVLTLATLIYFIVVTFNLRKLKTLDLNSDFHRSLLPFLDDMAEDAAPKSRMQLDMDLSGLTKEKITQHGKIDPGRFKKVIETIYVDPWCKLLLELNDGTLLKLDIENEVVCHDRHWTRRRGGKTKFKRKKKWRKEVMVTAGIIPREANLEWNEQEVAQRAETDKFKLKEKGNTTFCRLVRKFKFKQVNSPPEESAPPRKLVGMFMELFALLQPVEARS